MFNVNLFIAETVKVSAQSAVKAATLKTVKGATQSDIDGYNACRDYVALSYAADAIDADLNTRAHDMLKRVVSKESYETVSKSFKHVYAADYMARFPKNADKCKAAVDMAWSRCMRRAEVKGWVKPDLSSKTVEAVKAANKRAEVKATKAANNGGKPVDGRANGNNRKPKPAQPAKTGDSTKTAQPSAIVNTPAIVVHAEKDAELRAALDWIAQSGDNKRAFVEWFKSQKVAQLQSVKAA